jgi:hypothetical protein
MPRSGYDGCGDKKLDLSPSPKSAGANVKETSLPKGGRPARKGKK